MARKRINLTEGYLRKVIRESVNKLLKESYDWEVDGEINIADRVYDGLGDILFDDEQLRGLEGIINKMDDDNVFTIMFSLDARDTKPVVESMTTTEEVMDGIKKYINDAKLLQAFEEAVNHAISSIDDDDLKNNVEYYYGDNYDFYGDSSNFLPRGV